MRRVELLESRQRAAAGVPEWLDGFDPESPEAQSWIESHYDLEAWYESMTDAERLTLDQTYGVDRAALGADDLETVATLSGRLKFYPRAVEVVRRNRASEG